MQDRGLECSIARLMKLTNVKTVLDAHPPCKVPVVP
jgi:hypothetical protein